MQTMEVGPTISEDEEDPQCHQKWTPPDDEHVMWSPHRPTGVVQALMPSAKSWQPYRPKDTAQLHLSGGDRPV